MSSHTDWNPTLYLKFKNERTQPSIDLVSRIDISDPKRIIDIGCGPGNSTEILLGKWPHSTIAGLDASPAMIERAKQDYPQQTWMLGDASKIGFKTRYDIVFSNATIQWIPNHEKLLLDLIGIVDQNGALAVQVPRFNAMPICTVIRAAFDKTQGGKRTFDFEGTFTFHNASFYYDILADHVSKIAIWETSYCHVMNSSADIIEMVRSTGMKPYLDLIDDENEKAEFEREVSRELDVVYPKQKNGKVIFPFKRLFFIAYK